MTKCLSIYLLVPLLLFLMCISCYQGTSTQTIAPKEFLPQFLDAGFLGERNSWFITREGDLFRTEDGGRTWENLSRGALGVLQSACFIDSHYGWSVNKKGQIWASETGGHSWIKGADLGEKYGPINIIRFINRSQGWIVGTIAILRTENGGKDWESYFPYNDPKQIKAQILSAYFLDNQHGWVGGTQGTLYQSVNGGLTWQGKRVLSIDGDIRDIFFIDAQRGWLLQAPSGTVYSTQDGGNTWIEQKIPSQNLYLVSIHFVNQNEGWIVGTDREGGAITTDKIWGVLLHTIDGGKTWQFVETGKREPFYTNIYFTSPHIGWLISRDNIYRSEDGGKT